MCASLYVRFCLAFSCCNKAQIIESTQARLPALPLAPSPHLPAASHWGVHALTHSDTHVHVWSHSCGHECKLDADGWECVRRGQWGRGGGVLRDGGGGGGGGGGQGLSYKVQCDSQISISSPVIASCKILEQFMQTRFWLFFFCIFPDD